MLGQIRDELCGDLVGERLELDRGHVPAAASPLELGPGGGDDQQRAAHVADRPLEQLEQRRLGPVDVFHEQDDRASRAGLVQELDPGIPETVARRQRVQVAGDVAAEREAEDRPIVERAGLLLKDLPDGPVGPRRPVGQAPADVERRALRASLEPRPQLAQEAALAHAGVAEDDRELRLAVLDRAFVRAAEGVELVTAPDERPLVGAAGPDRRQRPHEQPAGDGLALPLRVDVLQVAELERAPGRLRGSLAHDDLAGVRSLLEARAHVHGVAGDERAVRVGVDDHLAGVHADPQRERRVELGETLAHRERRVKRTLGVVLQRRGSAERRHHGVAGELLDGAADPLDLLRHRREEPVEQDPHRLGVGLADRGRADEIGEEHGRDLPLHVRIVAQLAGSDLVDANRRCCRRGS